MSSAPATNMDSATWLCRLLQLGDTFYPTGAYAHSFGLEGLVAEGVVRDRETLRQFILLSALPSLKQTELPLVIHSWHALALPDWSQVAELNQLSSALKTAHEARLASHNIGRQRVELLVKLCAHPLAIEYLRRAEESHWALSASCIAALEARVLEAPLNAALASVFYASIAGLLAAAMKLLRLGQNGAQTLLTELMMFADETFACAKNVPIEDIGWFNPWLDIAAARHETAAARLFIS